MISFDDILICIKNFCNILFIVWGARLLLRLGLDVLNLFKHLFKVRGLVVLMLVIFRIVLVIRWADFKILVTIGWVYKFLNLLSIILCLPMPSSSLMIANLRWFWLVGIIWIVDCAWFFKLILFFVIILINIFIFVRSTTVAFSVSLISSDGFEIVQVFLYVWMWAIRGRAWWLFATYIRLLLHRFVIRARLIFITTFRGCFEWFFVRIDAFKTRAVDFVVGDDYTVKQLGFI